MLSPFTPLPLPSCLCNLLPRAGRALGRAGSQHTRSQPGPPAHVQNRPCLVLGGCKPATPLTAGWPHQLSGGVFQDSVGVGLLRILFHVCLLKLNWGRRKTGGVELRWEGNSCWQVGDEMRCKKEKMSQWQGKRLTQVKFHNMTETI